MSEHVHLSVPMCKSKSCKIAQNITKVKQIEIHSHVAQESNTKHDKGFMVHWTWKENDYQPDKKD